VTEITYDVAFDRLQELAADMAGGGGSRNEATTRLQLIDRLIFDCLDWRREDAELEDHENGQFADYVLDRRARALIVEAKKEGTWFELPDGLARRSQLKALYALGGTVADALTQAEQYSQERGTPYAAICNGRQLVAFIASRQDGVAPRHGQALVFDSPEAMVDDFADLWAGLSRLGCAARRLTRMLKTSSHAVPPKLSEQIADYPGTKNSTERQLMLATLNVLFLPAYVRDDDEERTFLTECYSPPGAFSHLAVLSRSVLRTRYSTALGEELKIGLEEAHTKEGLNQALLDEVAVTTAGREPIVLLGSVGVGKTMFLRRLLLVDAEDLAANAIVLYIDLGRSAVLDDLGSHISGSFRDQLLQRYGVDVDEADFLRGTYHSEVRRFATGINAPLRDLDPKEYARREIDHLAELSRRTEEHLRRSLEHLVKLRKQQIIVVLDNVDQRNQEDQEQVFLISETIAKNWPCTVFVTLRPETFNASRTSGALAGYQPRAFTVQPPRVERVVVTRLEFGVRHYEQEGHLPQWLGWTAESPDLRRYLGILLKSFSRSERLQTALINLSGGNTRRALELMTAFVNSPHSDAEDTFERNRGRRDFLIPAHTFIRAILLGDAQYYDPARSQIPNLFDMATDQTAEHFLLPCLLGLLRRASEQRDTEGYVAMEDVYGTFQDVGFTVDQVDFALQRAVVGDFVETLPPDRQARSLRLTTAGAYGYATLSSNFQYHDLVVVDTPIADPAVRQDIRAVRATRQRLERADSFLSYLDWAWERSSLSEMDLFDWPKNSSVVREEMAYIGSRL
jgi:hypothetical protein